MAIYSCEQCGQPFKRPPSHVTRHPHNFCSRPCRENWMSIHIRGKQNPHFASIEITCDQCGMAFNRIPAQVQKYRNHFCSKQCHAAWKTRRVPCLCAQCDTPISRKPTDLQRTDYQFCSAQCYHRWRSLNKCGEDSPLWRGGKIGYYGPNWLEQRRKARKRDKYRCRRCDVHERRLGQELHVHHIIPFRGFGYKPDENDYYLRANHLDNLVCLCNSCHRFVECGETPMQIGLLL